jgi:hypothetical protein
MAGKGLRHVEAVFGAATLVVAVGLLIAHFATGKEAYLNYGFIVVVVALPIGWVLRRALRQRAH